MKRTIALALIAALASSGNAHAFDRVDMQYAANRWAWDTLDPDWASGTNLTYTWAACTKRPAGWVCRIRAQMVDVATDHATIQVWWLRRGKLAPKRRPVRRNELYVVDGDVKGRMVVRGTRGFVFYVSSRWSQNA